MIVLVHVLGMLAFRPRTLRVLAGQRLLLSGWIVLGAGFLVYTLARDWKFAAVHEPPMVAAPRGLFASFFQLNLIQALLFLALVYVPAVICLSNAFAGDGLGFSFSREEYQNHVSVLFPLWGTIFLLVTPLYWFGSGFLVLGVVEISVASLALIILMVIYSVWAIKQLNYIPFAAALGVFVLSWFTFPVFYLLTMFFFALPLFIMIPLGYLGLQRARGVLLAKSGEAEFQRHLQSLTVNPQDADAHHQLGLIHLKRGNFTTAQSYFETALKIDPSDADYHYYLGRVFEEMEEWPKALEQYSETYRLNAGYGVGDIFREVGKAYLHTDNVEKAVEFLRFFLETRASDPQGRCWLAVAYQKLGQIDEMGAQLSAILEQARSNPRFFRKENRKWLYRARVLLRQLSSH